MDSPALATFEYTFIWLRKAKGLGSYAGQANLADNLADGFYLMVEAGGVLSDFQHYSFSTTAVLQEGWYQLQLAAMAIAQIALVTDDPGEED